MTDNQRVTIVFTPLEFAKLAGMAAGSQQTVQEVIKRKLFEKAPSSSHDWDMMDHRPGDRAPGESDF